jgi:hypothetical protein
MKSLVYITGKTNEGDESVGTGLHLYNDMVLTCAHVVNDLDLDGHVTIQGRKIEIIEHEAHPKYDVGAIKLRHSLSTALPDVKRHPELDPWRHEELYPRCREC